MQMTCNQCSVLHVVAGLSARAGGPSRSVVGLTDALAAERRMEVGLISEHLSVDEVVNSANPLVMRELVCRKPSIGQGLALEFRKRLMRRLRERKPALIHGHGIWTGVNHWSVACARRLDIPMVIHPRGMLAPWALAWRGIKKRLALYLYQRQDLEYATVLFATAEQEALDLRRLGLRQPIAVIPNGIETEREISSFTRGRMSRAPGKKKALYLGRIHPVKNLLNLIDAWAALNSPCWHLQLAGPDEDGHLIEVLGRIEALGLRDRVQYLGSIADQDKRSLYESVDLFILPSFSENFGIVVAEALSHGLPVIATRGTPWRGLERHSCGWWVDPTVDGLLGALRDASAKEPAQLHQMGLYGRAYAREFDWACIARNTLDVYRWVLGQGGRPDCVYLD